MITAIIDTGSTYCNAVSLTYAEIEERKDKLRSDAQKFLLDNDVDHIIYYHDERDSNGEITKCWLYYNMIGLDHTTFIERCSNVHGCIGEVHKSELDNLLY